MSSHLERKTSLPGNFIRGAMIGTVETVPGVSGGTVALVVGIYEQLIDSASHVVSAARVLISGPDRRRSAMEHLKRAHWNVVIPVVIGMFLAVFTVAGPVADAVENYPVLTRAAFFGMVLASVAVPLRMAGVSFGRRNRENWADGVAQEGSQSQVASGVRARHVIAGAVALVVAFWLVAIPPTTVEATPVTIIAGAAVAVCALLLPGLSGSFLLLTFGLYEPTMRAVSERDFGYLGLFMVGAILGMVCIVKVLKWLLTNYHHMTLLVLSGVMVGALRVLWPWQDDNRGLHAPGDEWPLALGLGLLGFVIVTVLIVVDARMAKAQRVED